MKEDGFTIVEILATIVVMGLVAIGISGLFYGLQYTQRQSAYLETATRAAQRKVESLRNSTYNSLTPGQTTTFTNELPNTLPKNKTGTVAVTEPSAGLRRVNVRVAYNDGSKQQEVNLSALIGVIGISQ